MLQSNKVCIECKQGTVERLNSSLCEKCFKKLLLEKLERE